MELVVNLRVVSGVGTQVGSVNSSMTVTASSNIYIKVYMGNISTSREGLGFSTVGGRRQNK